MPLKPISVKMDLFLRLVPSRKGQVQLPVFLLKSKSLKFSPYTMRYSMQHGKLTFLEKHAAALKQPMLKLAARSKFATTYLFHFWPKLPRIISRSAVIKDKPSLSKRISSYLKNKPKLHVLALKEV